MSAPPRRRLLFGVLVLGLAASLVLFVFSSRTTLHPEARTQHTALPSPKPTEPPPAAPPPEAKPSATPLAERLPKSLLLEGLAEGDVVSSEAELRLREVAVRYQTQLAHLSLDPGHVVQTTRLPILLAEQDRLSRELTAIAELADPAQTSAAVTLAAELDRAFAAWLESATESASDEATIDQLTSLADRYYTQSEQGFTMAKALSP